MERPKGEHLLLEVVKDDAVHPRAELRWAFAILRVVGEPAPGGLELTRVEDELAGGPGAARLGARRGVGLGVGRVQGRFRLEGGLRLPRLQRELARPNEPWQFRTGGKGLGTCPAAVGPEVGRVLAEVGLERLRAAEVHDVAQLGVAWDLPAASAGALAREGVLGDRAQTRGLGSVP